MTRGIRLILQRWQLTTDRFPWYLLTNLRADPLRTEATGCRLFTNKGGPMTIRTFAIVLAGALPLAAQTKISGTINCAKPDPMHQVDVGDRPGHVMMLSKVKCEWSKPIEMEGLKSKSGESTQSDDASAKNSRARSVGNVRRGSRSGR